MKDPVCFSQYFVNKQNVRSFSNILNSNLLKSVNNHLFLENIIKNEILVREISIQLQDIIFELQRNIKTYCKQDFKNYFLIPGDKYKDLQAVNKIDIYESISKALKNIIPTKLFGNNHNRKIFNKCTKLLIFSMKRQYVCFERLIRKWDYTILPWSNLDAISSCEFLYCILHWIFKVLLSAMISLNFYVTTCKMDSDENKLYYFWKNHWQSFYDRKLSEMKIAKIINMYEPYCLGKNVRRKYNAQERLKLKAIKRKTPKLHLVLKINSGYRPIVRYKNEAITTCEKYKIKERLHFLQTLNRKCQEKIENKFLTLYTEWLRSKPNMYFVKTDLSNAFGSINKIKLLRILAELYLELQKREKSSYVKKKFAQQYKEMIAELRRPLLIRSGSTIYEWREGLVQGYKYSPALSELYYSYLDNINFSKHMNNESDKLKLFIRVVDDYLYITDSLEDAHLFLDALSNYRNVNYNKTFVNFSHPVIRINHEITFLGYSYNTASLQVSRANAVFTGDMCFKIRFSVAIKDLDKFIENRIGQSGIQINGHIFNFYYNNEKVVWHHIFTTLCLSANKFCTILAILCDESQMSRYLIVYKKRVTVKLCNTIIKTLKRNQPPNFIFKYCINHFRYLSNKALLLCSQQTTKCDILVPFINVELAKTNCINGKWNEHSSQINVNGGLTPARREICKRADLKIFMKDFEKLPESFQCFNRKRFYQ